MRAAEFTEDGAGRLLWTLPAERSKNKRARVTPILGLAREILEEREWVCCSKANPADRTTLDPWPSSSVRDGARFRSASSTSHDLRRSAATMMVKAGLSLELVATIVGHAGGGGAGTAVLVRHYVHDEFLDRKAAGLAQWDRRLRAILAGGN